MNDRRHQANIALAVFFSLLALSYPLTGWLEASGMTWGFSSDSTYGVVRTAPSGGGTASDVITAGDARLPTLAEKAALAGTYGAPSGTNKYVTDQDTRISGGGFVAQGGAFTVPSGQLTATIPLAAPITTTYSVVTTLGSPVTIITVGTTRTNNFDVTLEWNGSGASGNWMAVRY